MAVQPAIRNPQSEMLAAEAAAIAAYVRRFCPGRFHARPKWRIRGELASAGCRIAERAFDEAVHQAVLSGLAFGSNERGFFWMVKPEDFDEAYRYIETRFGPMGTRMKAIRRLKCLSFGQADLFSQQAEDRT